MTFLNLTLDPVFLDKMLQFLSSLLLDTVKYRDSEMNKMTSLQFLLSLVREDSLPY